MAEHVHAGLEQGLDEVAVLVEAFSLAASPYRMLLCNPHVSVMLELTLRLITLMRTTASLLGL